MTLHDATGQDACGRFLREEATVALDLWVPNPERVLAATTHSGAREDSLEHRGLVRT